MKLWHLVLVAAIVSAFVVGAKLVHRAGNHAGTAAVGLVKGIPDQAASRAAEANVQDALGAVQQYFADHGNYTGMSATALRAYEPALSGTLQVRPAAGGACIEDTVRGVTASATNGGGVVAAPCR